MSMVNRCSTDNVDIFSNRLVLPTTSLYQYSLNIMYLPSEFEVYMLKQFEIFLEDYKCYTSTSSTQSDCPSTHNWENDNPSTAIKTYALLTMKMRFRGHEAEHHAAEDISNFNARSFSAEDCESDGGQTAFSVTPGEKNKFPASGQDPCVYMNYLLMIMSVCTEVHKQSKAEGQCQEAVAMILQLLASVCDGTCASGLMSDYFCTSVSSLTGTTCTGTDVLYYYMSASSISCDPWYQQFSPDYCSNSGFADPSDAASFALDLTNDAGFSSTISYAGGTCDGRRLDAVYGEISINRRGLCHDEGRRRLSHDITSMSMFEDMSSLDNIIPFTDWIASDSFGQGTNSGMSFMKFPDAYSTSATYTNDEYDQQAGNMLQLATDWLVDETKPTSSEKSAKEHSGRVSLISIGLKDVLTSDAPGEYIYSSIRDFFGEFLHHVAQVWESLDSNTQGERQDIIPIFASCDPEFEESLVRDFIEVQSALEENDAGVLAGFRGACSEPPFNLPSSFLQLMKAGKYARGNLRFFF